MNETAVSVEPPFSWWRHTSEQPMTIWHQHPHSSSHIFDKKYIEWIILKNVKIMLNKCVILTSVNSQRHFLGKILKTKIRR